MIVVLGRAALEKLRPRDRRRLGHRRDAVCEVTEGRYLGRQRRVDARHDGQILVQDKELRAASIRTRVRTYGVG